MCVYYVNRGVSLLTTSLLNLVFQSIFGKGRSSHLVYTVMWQGPTIFGVEQDTHNIPLNWKDYSCSTLFEHMKGKK